jgi:hypothetical protein
MVRLPSGTRYWTVLDEDLAVVPVADSFLRQVRFGRDGAESTTRAYAGGIALFLRWCARTGRDWQAGIGQLGLFMTWLLHAGPSGDGAGAEVVAGPGARPARSARRVNAVLAAVRGMVVHAVAEGAVPGYLVQVLYEVADDRDLPDEVRPEEGGTGWRMRARHRVRGAAPVPDPDLSLQREVVGAFFAAARGGDFDALVTVLDPEVVLRADGGPKHPSATTVLRGPAAVAGQAIMFADPAALVRPALVNGAAGVVITVGRRPVSVMAFTVVGGKIAEINAISDPERLRRLDLAIPGD